MDSLDRKIPIAGPAQPVQRRPTFAEKLLEGTEDAKEGVPAPPKPSPSIKKASSSADKQFKKATSMKPETSSPTSEQLSTIKPPAPPAPELETRPRSAIPGGESKVDAWIRQEMSRIKERSAFYYLIQFHLRHLSEKKNCSLAETSRSKSSNQFPLNMVSFSKVRQPEGNHSLVGDREEEEDQTQIGRERGPVKANSSQLGIKLRFFSFFLCTL